MIVKPWNDLKQGIMFLSFVKIWENDKKLLILTNSEGVIDSMSEELMSLFKISMEELEKPEKYKIQWFLNIVSSFYKDL
jgi:hypothetical protein